MKSSIIFLFFVNLRKKFILPLKWWLTELTKRERMDIRTKKEIQIKLKYEKLELLEAQRLENRDKIKVQEGKLELLNWLINGNTES